MGNIRQLDVEVLTYLMNQGKWLRGLLVLIYGHFIKLIRILLVWENSIILLMRIKFIIFKIKMKWINTLCSRLLSFLFNFLILLLMSTIH